MNILFQYAQFSFHFVSQKIFFHVVFSNQFQTMKLLGQLFKDSSAVCKKQNDLILYTYKIMMLAEVD